MDTETNAAVEFLRDNHRGIVMTRGRDDTVQSSPVAVTVDAASGYPAISTREPLVKVRNLRRDPRISVCTISDSWYGPWAQIDGEVEIVELPEALELLVDYYRSIRGEHPDWDDYREAMVREERVLLRIHPLRGKVHRLS